MKKLLIVCLLLALLLGIPGPSARGALSGGTTLPAGFTAVTTCGHSSEIENIIAQVDITSWSGWVRKLSGAEPVTPGGVTITSRYSPYLFDGTSPAYDFIKETVTGWYPGQVEEISYIAPYPYQNQTWKNLVLTISGHKSPGNIVLLTAHLDSTAYPYSEARGANDNATGSATLLEAARVLRENPLPNTVRLIWFSGEEQGLWGSRAYANTVTSWNGVIGVVNVDMIGYDGNNDRCLELHVGTLPASHVVGSCFVDVITAYNLDLKYDYLTTTAISASDHASFWAHGIGAVEVLENYRNDRITGGCTAGNTNPYYHQSTDTFENLSMPYSFDVARAALATTFSLARQPHLEWYYFPIFFNQIP